MPDYTFFIYQRTASNSLVQAGEVTIRDSNNFQDLIFNDVETGDVSDQIVIASTVPGLGVGNTIRTRTIDRFTNDDTAETYDAPSVFSDTAGGFPANEFFVLTSALPDWMTDGTSRSWAPILGDGTTPYANIICFAGGTAIETPDGDRCIDELRVGDLVTTLDHGPQPIRWIGKRRISKRQLQANAKLRPVSIAAGAIGPGCPRRSVMLSRQHRILIRSMALLRACGDGEALAPAVGLLDLPGVRLRDGLDGVSYYHILLDRHEIVCANGLWAETLFLGPQARRTLSPADLAEIAVMFPEQLSAATPMAPARALLSRKDTQAVVRRNHKNTKPSCRGCNSR
jgi:hypothetical protein